jgi:threonine/homoserine/homoserine lactone efflux protein
VPLSEEEQRLLQQMEQALAAEDPKFASALRGSTLRARSRRHALLAAVGFVLGVVALMLGAVLQRTPVAVAGFLAMLATAYLFVTLWRRAQGSATQAEAPGSMSRRTPSTSSRGSSSFMERMEERWRRRRDDDA